MTREQVAELSVEDVDFHWEEDGLISIRTCCGKRQEYFAEIPGVGPEVGIPFLQELMWSPGQFQRQTDLARRPGLASFRNPNRLSARLTKLRRVFRERGRKPWYFVRRNRPFRVAWHPDRAWRFIVRLAEPEGWAATG